MSRRGTIISSSSAACLGQPHASADFVGAARGGRTRRRRSRLDIRRCTRTHL